MIDLKGLNGVEIDRVKKAYAQGVENGFQQGRNDIKPLIDEIHDNVYQEGEKKGRAEVIDLIDRHLWNYSHEVWEDFKPILEQLKEKNIDK